MIRLRRGNYVAGFFGAVGLAAVLSTGAYAIDNTYFDNSDAGGTTIHVGIGKTDYVQQTSAKLKAYFNTNSGQVQFVNYTYCPSGDDEGPASSKKTKFTVNGNGGQVRIGSSGAWSGSKSSTSDYVTSGSKKCDDTLTFNLRNLTKDPAGSGKFVAVIDVDNTSTGYMNYFKVKTPTSGGKISHAKGSRGWDVTVDQIGSSPKNIDYKIKFGSDCSVKSNVRKSIRLYDLDGPGGSGAQVGAITLKLREKPISGGSWSYIKIVNQKSVSNSGDPGGGSTSIRPLNKENDDQLVYFTAKPNRIYEFELNNIYYNNTIQFGAPFDGIFYQTGCQNWDADPFSYVKVCDRDSWGSAGRTITVSRPTKVCFTHRLKNYGPGLADTKAMVQRNWNASKVVGGYANVGSWNNFTNLGVDASGSSPDYSLNFPTSVTTAPDGTTYCQRYHANPKKKVDAGTTGTATSTPACAKIGISAAPYDLYAHISVAPRTYSYYPTVTATGSVSYTGTPSGNHTWQMYAVRYSEKPNLTLGGESGNVPACNQLPVDDRIGDCELIHTGVFPTSSSQSVVYTTGGPDPVGTYLCFFTRVQDPTEESDDNTNWKYSSTLACSVSGVKPKVQVRGGDTKAGGVIETSWADIQTRRLGSWGEYGVLSNGSNYAMGSAATLGLPTIGSGSPQSSWSNLTFRNNGLYGSFGGSLTHASISQNNATVYNSNLEIDNMADILAGGSRRTIVVNGTLTISDSLIYSDTAASIRNIPRIVIIANNIVISSNVRQIDPWLVANNLSTCDQVAGFPALGTYGLLDSGKCSEPLRFNGPVIADKLYLYRTHDTVDGEPAETFNLRADNFLSSYAGGVASDPVATTSVVKEAPPRF